MKKNLFILFVVLFTISCQEVIQLDLQNIPPKLVVESSILQDSKATVVISKTINYYNPKTNPPINNAIIYLSNQKGARDTLIYDSILLHYKGKNISGTVGDEYTILVKVENETIEAKSKMLAPIVIDSVSLKISPNLGFQRDGEKDSGEKFNKQYDIIYYLKLNSTEEQYFKVKTSQYDSSEKEEFLSFETTTKSSLFQKMPTANSYKYTSNRVSLDSTNLSVQTEIQSINKAHYLFLESVRRLEIGQGPGTVFYNPVGNFSGDALGFFQAIGLTKKTFTLKRLNLKQ